MWSSRCRLAVLPEQCVVNPRERNLRGEQKGERRTNSIIFPNEISGGVLVGTRKFLVRGRVYRIEVLVVGLEGKGGRKSVALRRMHREKTKWGGDSEQEGRGNDRRR